MSAPESVFALTFALALVLTLRCEVCWIALGKRLTHRRPDDGR